MKQKFNPPLGVFWGVISNSVVDMHYQLLVYCMTTVDGSGGGHWRDGACSFFADTMYNAGDGAVFSGMGDVNSGSFGMFKVWGSKGVCFVV